MSIILSLSNLLNIIKIGGQKGSQPMYTGWFIVVLNIIYESIVVLIRNLLVITLCSEYIPILLIRHLLFTELLVFFSLINVLIIQKRFSKCRHGNQTIHYDLAQTIYVCFEVIMSLSQLNFNAYLSTVDMWLYSGRILN